LLKRTSIKTVNQTLKNNQDWNVLDIGCGYTANKYANIVADAQDLSKFYKDKNFIQITEKKLPFKDKEFDFVITSHVIEHVENFQFFLKEIERISKQGYIELPSRLGDNLVIENLKDHIWWFKYDDELKLLIASKKNQFLEPFINVSTAKKLEYLFRESLIIELLWEDKIDYKFIDELEGQNQTTIGFKYLIKKYFSKKIRVFLSRLKSK
jgi:ubiquinone/menaquinone biosynthesis C-methylase UbiE|tara:strand:- start:1740 stop:2369 length:630 start_codon:yes stop_codon:yes gene_type:complete